MKKSFLWKRLDTMNAVHSLHGGGCCDTLLSNDYKQPIIVAYAVENHPCDSRVTMDDSGIVQTLNARMGTGGGNTPMVLMTIEGTNSNARFGEGEISPTVIARAGTGGGATLRLSCWGVYSHPMAGLIKLEETICPTITAKMAKGASDGPLVLIKENR